MTDQGKRDILDEARRTVDRLRDCEQRFAQERAYRSAYDDAEPFQTPRADRVDVRDFVTEKIGVAKRVILHDVSSLAVEIGQTTGRLERGLVELRGEVAALRVEMQLTKVKP